MSAFKLLISIVPHDRGEKLTRAAMESGCRGGTVLIGRGLANSNLAAVLGLGESTKDVIMMVAARNAVDSIWNAIVMSSSRERRNFGQLFCVDADSVMKAGNVTGGANMENAKTENEMITVIVNKGYADDVMAAARSAGAGGGTVLNARGTARENDERFFGMHIVPEKEMLIMVVPSEKKEAVMNAIKEIKCLKEPGMGIAFSAGVENFSMLGKKK
ncbi:MAG: transcriptional regulator [Treponema sp.]|nr:transcriptional regulator [Candidatus Treponema equifaecale]